MSNFDADVEQMKERIRTTRASGGDIYFTDKGRKIMNSPDASNRIGVKAPTEPSLRHQDLCFLTLLAIPALAALAGDLGWL